MAEKKKRIFMIYHGRFPAELGIAFFVAKMAEAFVNLGMEVFVVVPRRLGRTKQTSEEYFGIKSDFKVVFIPVIDLLFVPVLEKISFLISLFSFSVFSTVYLLLKAKKEDIIHSSDTPPLLVASYFFPKTVYEIHNYPKAQRSFYELVFRRVWKIIVTNRWKMEKLVQEFSIPKERMTYESNAVDFKLFPPATDMALARNKLSLPQDKFILTYVGMLRTMGMEKGLSDVFSIIKNLPEKFIFLLVGGTGGDIIYYKDLAEKEGITERVIFAGFVKNSEVSLYLAASNVLLAPFPKNDHYEFYMSPMKVFEYMTSNRPIVTTNLTSIKEILSNDACLFTESGDIAAMKDAILKIEKDPSFGLELARKAREEVEEHSWDKRAERLISFF